jgi:tripartite-type tricarboxylate transporter receptor subunit TctC
MPSIIQHIRSGSLRALGVTTAERSPQLPDVQAIGETVKGYEASALFGMGAPAKTPKEIVAKLNEAINTVMTDAAMKKQLEDLGGAPRIETAEAFNAEIAAETEKWKKVVEFSGLKID